MLSAFVIAIPNHAVSQAAADICIESIHNTGSLLIPEKWPAVTPDTLESCDWRWPANKTITCAHTGLKLTAYKNRDVRHRIACAQSHYQLWQKCVAINQPICILEHDAVFTHKFDLGDFEGGALALNDPQGATFRAREYDQALTSGVNPVPWVADQNIPQGLPGNSAYVIKPWAAQHLITAQNRIGWWPNDAIMCRQLFDWLRIIKPYYTRVQGTPSTTSG
jgi:GR25 family glycosyltransferase involved in LPS biosynthesis